MPKLHYLILALLFASAASFADSPDYSKEAAVIQNMAIQVSFSADGAREWRQTISVRVQSEAAVRQFGVLALSYEAENEQAKIEYVRVRKPDGSVIETPDASVQDVATEVAASAPTYSDLRQKQIPVKALGVGDVLEYSFRSVQQKPEIPGQFWYVQYLIDDGVVLNQTVEITFPKNKFVQVSSPNLKFVSHDDGDRRTYTWQNSLLNPTKADDQKKPADEKDAPKIQITTFRNWEEVGAWWSAVATPQAAVTPTIQAKAQQLTAGLSSDSDKAKAIYNYVGMKFRYISISLGAGRYRPHTADEVLANQYGDCKDKHTLFVALLKAAGIQAWPALIGSGIKFDATVPSPAQFNHVITVLPADGKYTWLDTTTEVAPFGLLVQAIRDEQALVIPAEGKPVLVKTPADPPFKTADVIDVKAALDTEGTLTGHFDIQLVGDNALLLRSAFRQLAPTQWQPLAQQMSYALGYGGDVSAVDVENLENTDKPFHYSYDYKRKPYSDWAELRFTLPMPPLGFGPGEEAEKPKEPFAAGAPGTQIYRALFQLPKGLSSNLLPDVTLTTPFADYTSRYSMKDGSIAAERKMVIKKAKVKLEEWVEYRNFIKAVHDDQTTFMLLVEADKPADPPVSDYNPEAENLINNAAQAIQSRNLNQARDLIGQAERLNPKQARLWAMKCFLAMNAGKLEEAISDGYKEIQFHPDEIPAYQQLAQILLQAGRRDEALQLWRGALAVKPDDSTAASYMAALLIQAKRYSEVPAILAKPIAASPDNYYLQVARVEALLRGGRKEEGMSEAKKIAAATSDSMIWNDLAYYLADTDSSLDLATEWAQRAVAATEQDSASQNLDSFTNREIRAVNSLAAKWDTLGWIYFKRNNLAAAEKYLDAAWHLSQGNAEANHLGQLYEKQGKAAAAIHMWRLAIAVDSRDEDSRERLRKAGASVTETPAPVPALEELGQIRTIKIPALPKQTGSAEFFLLFSRHGIEDTRLIGNSDTLANAGPAIQSAKAGFPFPDEGPEKIIRRGVLSCSADTTPSCQLTLLLPATTTMAEMKPRLTNTEAKEADASAISVISPTLRSKVEPEYTKAALDAKLEGLVVLSIVVNQEGIPEDVFVLKHLGLGLDEKAEECVSKWRFNPGTRDGKPVKVRAKVEVRFVIVKDGQSSDMTTTPNSATTPPQSASSH